MPSIDLDYTKQVKKMSSDIGIDINDLGDEYSLTSKNQYKRQLTIDLTGKPATNLICFVFDQFTFGVDRKSALNFCDLRVFDSALTTEYEYYVQSPNTRHCCVFIKFPTNLVAGSVTNIFVTYGNVALKSKSNASIVSSKLVSNDLIYAIRSNECSPIQTFNRDFDLVRHLYQVINHASANTMGATNTFGTGPGRPSFIVTTLINTLPVIRFAGGQSLPETYPNSKEQRFTDNYTSFIVAKSATLAGYTRLVSFDDATNYQIPLWWNAGTSQLVSINSADTGTSGISTGAVAGAWNILTTRRSRNTVGGLNTYRNSVAVASANTVNSPLSNTDLWIGSRFNTGEFSNADLAEVLIFNSYLSDTERLEIETYLNIKYRIDSTNLPVFTLGAEQANSYSLAPLSFAPFASWQSKSELDSKSWGVGGTTATAELLTMMVKTIASGSPIENWTASTVDKTNRIPSEYARKRIVGTVASSDTVNIYTALDSYAYANLVAGTAVYQSDLDDFIEFDFWCQDSSTIDTVNSYIQCSSLSGVVFARAALNLNQRLLVNGSNSVKIMKSTFVFSGDWIQVSEKLTLRLVTLSGTQEVLYNNFRLTQNLTQNDYYQIQNRIVLRNAVSSDNNLSYYKKTVVLGRIINQDLTEDNLKFTVWDYLELFKNKTFGDLNSFKGYDYYSWNLESDIGDFSMRIQYVIDRVMTLIFPDYAYTSSFFDFPGITPAAGNTFNLPNKSKVFTVYKTDKIGDVMAKILDNMFGYITYKPNDGALTVRSCRASLAYKDNTIVTSFLDDRLIYSFNDVSGEDLEVTNQINFPNYWPEQVFFNTTLCEFWSSKDLEVKPNQVTQIFLQLSDFEQTQDKVILGNLRVNVCDLSTVQGQNTIDNTDIRVSASRLLDKETWVIDLTSNSSVTKYIRNLRMTANFIYKQPQLYDTNKIFNKKLIYDNPNLSIENGVVCLKNLASIQKYGKREITLDDFAYQGIEENATDIYLRVSEIYTNAIQNLGIAAKYVEINTQYQEVIRVGTLLKFNDKQKKPGLGYVTALEHYSDPVNGFVSNLRIRLVPLVF